jgi:hypothetical protein
MITLLVIVNSAFRACTPDRLSKRKQVATELQLQAIAAFRDNAATQLLNEPALFSLAKQTFSGDGLLVSYPGNGRTTKEATMKLTAIASRSAFTIDHDEWISCSHWGMFPVGGKVSYSRGET